VLCPALTVTNSNVISLFDITLATRLVSCSNGYTSIIGDTFVSTCEGTGPGVSAWSNVLTCDVVACPGLSVANSDTVSIFLTTSAQYVVNCESGYISTSGVSFTVTCDGTAPGVSALSNVLACSAVACASLTVSSSDTTSVYGSTLSTHLVSCDDGFVSSAGNTFVTTCQGIAPGVSVWSNVLTCDAVACSALTVANSDTTSIAGSTFATHTVNCVDGYTSIGGNSFAVTCEEFAPGISVWSNILTCEAVLCEVLTVVNSDSTLIVGSTLATHNVMCDDGYTSVNGNSFIVTCVGTSPGTSAWVNVQSCDAVQCAPLTVLHSDTSSVLGSTLATHLVTCDYGYTSTSGNIFTTICESSGPGLSSWSHVVACNPVSCQSRT